MDERAKAAKMCTKDISVGESRSFDIISNCSLAFIVEVTRPELNKYIVQIFKGEWTQESMDGVGIRSDLIGAYEAEDHVYWGRL